MNRLVLSKLARSLHTASAGHSSVNASEIAHFSRLSSLWWDEHGEFSFLHKMNPVRVRFVRDKLLEIAREDKGEDVNPNQLQGVDVLDVGCGGGLFSESLARMGARTVGIDASESNIAIASLHASADPGLAPSPVASLRKGSLAYRHTSAEALLEEKKLFDVVCSMEVIEHVDNPANFLETCAQLVKPGGHLFLSTIARTPMAYFLTIFMAEQVLRKVTPGTHTHSKYINPSELISYFQSYKSPDSAEPWIKRTYENGQPTRTEAEVRGMVYVPWNGEWILTPRGATGFGATDCNYLFWVRKPL
ncbi:hypothetical protein HWV62_32471 [Athelia sp. TMB]|nr:hypothetical protein HWV62_32471 [Athelia sp. TMB]